MKTSEAEPVKSRGRALVAGALLAAATAIAYIPALRSGFVWDDDTTLTANPLIKAADGLRQFWFTTKPADYWPVTYSALWAEWRLWGMHPMGYHAVNVALHVASALLIAVILKVGLGGRAQPFVIDDSKSSGINLERPQSERSGETARPHLSNIAWLAAFVFALHPVNVESVAWITQQKNLLAMLFSLLAVWFFLKAEESSMGVPPMSSIGHGRDAHATYLASLLSFTLAMLSKGSVAMLPVVLVGLIAWNRRLTFKDWIRTAPFFLVSGVLAMVDVWFQGHGSPEIVRNAGFLDRLLGAGAIVWFYLCKALLPFNLIFIYPLWKIRADNPLWWIPLLAAVGATGLLVHFSRRNRDWARPALFAWGYFCVMLVPVMGFTDVYFMKYSLVADHYQHAAMIGIVVFAAWAAAKAMGDRRGAMGFEPWASGPFPCIPIAHRLSPIALAPFVLLCILGTLTWRQCLMYHDDQTLYQTTIGRNPGSSLARFNWAGTLVVEHRFPEALAEYEEVLRIEPDSEDAHFHLGEMLAREGRLPEAIGQYEEALRLKPDYVEAHNNLGSALIRAGRAPEAAAQFEAALRLEPGNAEVHYNLGNALYAIGRAPDAIAEYGEALQLNPDYFEAHNNLGNLLAQAGRMPEAAAQFREALRLKPQSPTTHRNLGLVLRQMGRTEEAAAQFDEAGQLGAKH